MSSNPSWRLKQLKKKQSIPALSLVFAEPHSSPPRATAMDTLDTVQAKNAPAVEGSPRASLRRSPSLASVAGTSAAVSVHEPAARGSSRASKRQKLSDDVPVSTSPLSHYSMPGPSPPTMSNEAAAAESVESVSPPTRSSTVERKSGWFGSKKQPSNLSLDIRDSPAETIVSPPAAPALELTLEPAAESSSGPRDIPPRDPSSSATAHVGPSTLSRSIESAASDANKKRGGWFGFGGQPEVIVTSASLPSASAMPFTTSPESSPKISELPSLAPVTPPPTPPRRDPSPARSEPAPISCPRSNNDEASSSRKGWFGSLGRHSVNPSITSLPESIDSHAPSPDIEDSPVSPLPPATIVPIQQTVANMNSSGPRYTLSIPLLGRPKIPLEAIAKVEKEKKGPEIMDIELPPPEEKTNSALSTADSSASEDDRPGRELTPRAARQESSWLSYIWSAPQSTQSLPASPAAPVIDLPPSPAASNPELPTITTTLHDTPAVETSTSSAWYTPWSWYSSEVVAPAAEPQSPGSADTDILIQSRPQTPSVEQAEDENILLRTPEQRASWMGFFTGRSRASTMKKLHDSDGGMEVMDLDDELPTQLPNGTSTGSGTKDASISLPSTAQDKGKATVRNLVPTSATEPTPSKLPAAPMTDSQSVKHKVSAASIASRPVSPAPSKKGTKAPIPRAPNLVLPTFDDTFQSEPRLAPPPAPSALRRTLGMVRDSLFAHEEPVKTLGFDVPHHRKGDRKWARQLPRAWNVFSGGKSSHDVRGLLHGCKRVVIIGVHGWFPGAIMRTVLGEPTGTSAKFASMMETAVRQYVDEHGHDLDQITTIPLEGEGTISHRVEKLYQNLMAREDWVEQLHLADAIFVATHSQGSVVSTHLLHRLIHEGHIRVAPEESGVLPTQPTMPSWSGAQRVCCLALCGIHLGPLTYLHQSSILQPYLQYFESAAATELFQFQDTSSAVSKRYFEVLDDVLSSGVRFVYVASLDDQVVPIYSGTFTSISHPLVLRSLYIDGDAYNSSDFLSNLLILLLRLRNAGIDDAGLIALLSEATAGSLSGVGHSTAYEELGTYTLAVRFLFEASGVLHGPAQLHMDHFAPRAPRNDYEIPWALRHILADPRVSELFGQQFMELRAAFDDWQPKTAALKDIRRKLEPIRRLPTSRL